MTIKLKKTIIRRKTKKKTKSSQEMMRKSRTLKNPLNFNLMEDQRTKLRLMTERTKRRKMS